MRRPYSDDVDAFHLVELTDETIHADYLWSNAAWLCIRVLGEAFSDDGWQLDVQTFTKVDGNALHGSGR